MDFKEVLGRKERTITFLQNNNTVTVLAAVTITLSCPMSFTYFPFDKQSCSLELRLPGMTPNILAFNIK